MNISVTCQPIVLEAVKTFTEKMHTRNSEFTMSYVFFQGNHFKWLNVFTVVIRAANHLL